MNKFRKISSLEEINLPFLEEQKGDRHIDFPNKEMKYLDYNEAHILIYKVECRYKIAWWEGLSNITAE